MSLKICIRLNLHVSEKDQFNDKNCDILFYGNNICLVVSWLIKFSKIIEYFDTVLLFFQDHLFVGLNNNLHFGISYLD